MTDEDSGIDLARGHEVEQLVEDGLDPDLLDRLAPRPRRGTGRSLVLAPLVGSVVVLGLQRAWPPTSGTKAETSPPKRATSRTSLEATNDYSGLVGMKIVSTPERWLFIWAICISASKSDTARSPRTIADAPTSRAT